MKTVYVVKAKWPRWVPVDNATHKSESVHATYQQASKRAKFLSSWGLYGDGQVLPEAVDIEEEMRPTASDRFAVWCAAVWLWFSGREWKEKSVSLHRPSKWLYAPTGDFVSLSIHVRVAPWVVHRWLQFLCFGMRYKRSGD